MVASKILERMGNDRPADAARLDQLMNDGGFSEQGARVFLKAYDATIAYAGLSSSDKIESELQDEEEEDGVKFISDDPPPLGKKARTMTGERELMTGLLSRDAGFRLIVNGKVGVKEIERLIAKLKLDKEILAEPDDGDELGGDELTD